MSVATITIVRHAEAEGNYYRRAHGQYDSLLTPNGEAQVLALADRFAGCPFDAVYSSDLYRARRTAEALPVAGSVSPCLLPSLREIHLGDWEDIPWGELAFKEGNALEVFMNQPGTFRGKGHSGESMEVVGQRMYGEVCRLVRENRGLSIAVVSHGLAIRALMAVLMGLPPQSLTEIKHTDNAAVSLVKWDGRGEPLVLYHGDNSHLGDALSTLARQHWWREDSRLKDLNLWYRPADLPREAPLVLEFLKDAWRSVYRTAEGFSDAVAMEQSERMRSAHPGGVVFVMLDGDPVGLVQLDTQEETPHNTGHISLIYLTPKLRGQSLGGQLVGHAVSVYRSMGREALQLRVAEGNTRARRLYDALGFREISREDGRFCKLILMRKNIKVKDSIINETH